MFRPTPYPLAIISFLSFLVSFRFPCVLSLIYSAASLFEITKRRRGHSPQISTVPLFFLFPFSSAETRSNYYHRLPSGIWRAGSELGTREDRTQDLLIKSTTQEKMSWRGSFLFLLHLEEEKHVNAYCFRDKAIISAKGDLPRVPTLPALNSPQQQPMTQRFNLSTFLAFERHDKTLLWLTAVAERILRR